MAYLNLTKHTTTQWRGRLDEALAFQAVHHRLPRRSAGGAERALALWIGVQRVAYRKGGMSAAKVTLLDKLDGWETNAHQQRLDEAWRASLAAVGAFVAATGQMPRYKTYTSETEHTLGVWLHVQHQRRAEHTLKPWRLEALNEVVPGWRSRT